MLDLPMIYSSHSHLCCFDPRFTPSLVQHPTAHSRFLDSALRLAMSCGTPDAGLSKQAA